MGLLDKIIFIADFIEPHRYQAPNLPKIRRLSFEDLDLAMLEILDGTLAYLKQEEKEIDPRTAETYEYFKNLNPRKGTLSI
jgi:HD superfamily phosphohydrolase YqeK